MGLNLQFACCCAEYAEVFVFGFIGTDGPNSFSVCLSVAFLSVIQLSVELPLCECESWFFTCNYNMNV